MNDMDPVIPLLKSTERCSFSWYKFNRSYIKDHQNLRCNNKKIKLNKIRQKAIDLNLLTGTPNWSSKQSHRNLPKPTKIYLLKATPFIKSSRGKQGIIVKFHHLLYTSSQTHKYINLRNTNLRISGNWKEKDKPINIHLFQCNKKNTKKPYIFRNNIKEIRTHTISDFTGCSSGFTPLHLSLTENSKKIRN